MSTLNLFTILIWFMTIAFLFFGINCFNSNFIKTEFIRYGLPKFRKLTGVLQILGAIGLIVGYYFFPFLLFTASFGLFLLMTAGFVVRLKVKDNFIKSSPAFTFAIINFIIALKTLTKYFI